MYFTIAFTCNSIFWHELKGKSFKMRAIGCEFMTQTTKESFQNKQNNTELAGPSLFEKRFSLCFTTVRQY